MGMGGLVVHLTAVLVAGVLLAVCARAQVTAALSRNPAAGRSVAVTTLDTPSAEQRAAAKAKGRVLIAVNIEYIPRPEQLLGGLCSPVFLIERAPGMDDG